MEVASNQPLDKSEESSKSGDGSNSQKSSSSSSQSLTSLSSQSSGYDQPSTSGCSSDVPGETKRKNSHKKKLKKFISEMKLLVPPERLYGTKARTLVALSHAIACMKRIKNVQENSNAAAYPVNEPESTPRINFNNFKAEFSLKNGDGFAVAIHEGVVLDVSNSITELLGYPKEMLLGKQFVDFINPKDRTCFRSQVAIGLNSPFMDHGIKSGNQCTFFLRMRIHRGLVTNAFNLPDKRVVYKTFEVVLCMVNQNNEKSTYDDVRRNVANTPSGYFILKAAPVASAYKEKEETPVMVPFTTRHNANCIFNHVQPTAIPYIGYLPQDVIGNSIFDYYHPEDLSNMKESYEHVIQEQGRPFLGKPYRFRVHNGCHILLATEWSCFINPWTKKLEFVIGQHHVLKGPAEPNVFLECETEDGAMSDDPSKDGCNIQNEIKQLLSETIDGHASNSGKEMIVQRHTSVGSYMGNLIQDMVLNMPPVEKHGSKGESYSNRSSVVMGEISPHHKDSDSDSSETPPSYNHINYADHIQRYFDSQPKTHSSDTSGESKEGDREMDEEQKSLMPGDSSSSDRSGNQMSSMNSSSNPEDSPTAQDPIPSPPIDTNGNNSYRHVTLSEEVLSRHNEMTKKIFVQQHCEHRAGRSGSHYSRSDRDGGKTGGVAVANRKELQRLKRTSSQSPERDSPKINKHTHNEASGTEDFINPNASGPPITQIRMWPPFSLAVTMASPPTIVNQNTSQTTYRAVPNVPTATSSLATSGTPHTASNFALPTYAYMPAVQHDSPVPFSAAQGSGTLFMPAAVQYVNALPGIVYHPITPVMPQPGVGPIIVPNMAVYQPAIVIPRPVTTSAQISSPKDTYVVQSRKAPYTSSACHELKTTERIAVKANYKHDLGAITPSHRNNSDYTLFLQHQNRVESHVGANRSNAESHVKVEPTDSLTSPNCQNYCDENADSSSFSLDDLSGSSLYSFLKSEKSDDSPKDCSADKDDITMWDQTGNSNKQEKPPLFQVAKEPPWMEGVTVTSDLIYRYQLDAKDVEEVLREDLLTLQQNHQPDLVNEQLLQMYNEQENVDPQKEFFGFGFDNESDYGGDDGGINALEGLLATAAQHSTVNYTMDNKIATNNPTVGNQDVTNNGYIVCENDSSNIKSDYEAPPMKHKDSCLDKQPEVVEISSMPSLTAGPS